MKGEEFVMKQNKDGFKGGQGRNGEEVESVGVSMVVLVALGVLTFVATCVAL